MSLLYTNDFVLFQDSSDRTHCRRLPQVILDLKTIGPEPKEYRLELDPGWWEREGDRGAAQGLGLDSPLTFHATIYRAGGKYVLDGRLQGTLRLSCDRCLDPYRFEMQSTFRLFLAMPAPQKTEEEIELSGEDVMTDFIVGEEVDVDAIVREQIYLSLPMKSVCSPKCAGLCPKCGANLNKGPCGCQLETVPSAFDKLKHIKIKGD